MKPLWILLITVTVVHVSACSAARQLAGLHPAGDGTTGTTAPLPDRPLAGLHPVGDGTTGEPTPLPESTVPPEGVQVATDHEPNRTRVYQPPEWDAETTRMAEVAVKVAVSAAYISVFSFRW